MSAKFNVVKLMGSLATDYMIKLSQKPDGPSISDFMA
jgi:hypothetical protein